MPNYIFQCDNPECAAPAEEYLTMENRDALVGLPCSECGTGALTRPFLANMPRAKNMVDTKCSIDAKHPQAFRDNIQRVADSPGVKGTKYADRLKSRFI